MVNCLSLPKLSWYTWLWFTKISSDTCLPPAVRPGSARHGAPKITWMYWLLCLIYKTVLPKTIFILRRGDSLKYFFLYKLECGKCIKKLPEPQHSTQGTPAPTCSLKSTPHNWTVCNYNGCVLTIFYTQKRLQHHYTNTYIGVWHALKRTPITF